MKRICRHTDKKHRRHQKKQLNFLEAVRLYADLPVEKY